MSDLCIYSNSINVFSIVYYVYLCVVSVGLCICLCVCISMCFPVCLSLSLSVYMSPVELLYGALCVITGV
jgi:hypothetical protein